MSFSKVATQPSACHYFLRASDLVRTMRDAIEYALAVAESLRSSDRVCPCSRLSGPRAIPLTCDISGSIKKILPQSAVAIYGLVCQPGSTILM